MCSRFTEWHSLGLFGFGVALAPCLNRLLYYTRKCTDCISPPASARTALLLAKYPGHTRMLCLQDHSGSVKGSAVGHAVPPTPSPHGYQLS